MKLKVTVFEELEYVSEVEAAVHVLFVNGEADPFCTPGIRYWSIPESGVPGEPPEKSMPRTKLHQTSYAVTGSPLEKR